MPYKVELEELKELKKICYEVIRRIELIEKTCQEKNREWFCDMNKRLEALDARLYHEEWGEDTRHWKREDDEDKEDKKQLRKPLGICAVEEALSRGEKVNIPSLNIEIIPDENEMKGDGAQSCVFSKIKGVEPYRSETIGVRVDKSKATKLSETACPPPRKYSGLDDE